MGLHFLAGKPAFLGIEFRDVAGPTKPAANVHCIKLEQLDIVAAFKPFVLRPEYEVVGFFLHLLIVDEID